MTLRLTRGATFRTRLTLTNDPEGLTGAIIACQVRGRNFVTDLDIRVLTDAPGVIEISAPAATTADWPCALLRCDVRAVQPTGEVFVSQTFHIEILSEVTHG